MSGLIRALAPVLGRQRRWYDDSRIPSAGSAYGASTSISQDDAVHIAAIQACVSLLADTISTLPAGAYHRDGDVRVPLPFPDFMRQPDPLDPNVTWEDHLATALWSQELDGNIFTLVLPDVYAPAELRVVNPQRTTIRKRGVYELSMDGGGREVVGPDQLLHVARNRRPGDLRGMSPVEEAGTSFRMKRAADRFAERVFAQGIFLTGQMLLPGPASKETIEQLRTELAAQYGGPDNAGKPGIFANGARWDVPTPNLEAIQLLELHKAAKLEAAGLWRVPAYLIGVTDPGAMAYASVEQLGIDLVKFTVLPRTVRIEKVYRRLLGPDPNDYLRLSVSGLERGDFKTRAEGYSIYLQNKVMRRREVRAYEELPPDAEADGYLETPNNNPPDTTATATRSATEVVP